MTNYEIMEEAIGFAVESMQSEDTNYQSTGMVFYMEESIRYFTAYVALLDAYTKMLRECPTKMDDEIRRLSDEFAENVSELSWRVRS